MHAGSAPIRFGCAAAGGRRRSPSEACNPGNPEFQTPAAAAAPRQPTPQPAAPSRSPHEEFKRAWGKKLVANGWRPDVLGGDESTTPEDDEALRNMEFNANI
jgi:hypothetical protein